MRHTGHNASFNKWPQKTGLQVLAHFLYSIVHFLNFKDIVCQKHHLVYIFKLIVLVRALMTSLLMLSSNTSACHVKQIHIV